jgi:hypothetical protein
VEESGGCRSETSWGKVSETLLKTNIRRIGLRGGSNTGECVLPISGTKLFVHPEDQYLVKQRKTVKQNKTKQKNEKDNVWDTPDFLCSRKKLMGSSQTGEKPRDSIWHASLFCGQKP